MERNEHEIGYIDYIGCANNVFFFSFTFVTAVYFASGYLAHIGELFTPSSFIFIFSFFILFSFHLHARTTFVSGESEIN